MLSVKHAWAISLITRMAASIGILRRGDDRQCRVFLEEAARACFSLLRRLGGAPKVSSLIGGAAR